MAPELQAPQKKLTNRQSAFLDVLLTHPELSRTEAARLVGCGSGAGVSACRWMQKPHVIAEFERRRSEQLLRAGVEAHRILKETAAIAHSNVLDFLPALGLENSDLKKLTREQGAAIKEVLVEEFGEPTPEAPKPKVKRRITLKLAPKTPALELLGRHAKVWGEKEPTPPETAPGLNQFIGQQVNVTIRRVGD